MRSKTSIIGASFPVTAAMHRLEVALSFPSSHSREIQRWQPRLQRHERCHQPGPSTVAVPERMDQDQLDMHRSQAKLNLVAHGPDLAWRVFTKLLALELFHEARNL